MEQWCAVCCTRHDLGPRCPGELEATGVERFGWRVMVQTQARSEDYGVLVAPAGEFWRARIVTFPNMLWSVPGSRGTLKFVARSPKDVEELAAAFIREHCHQRGYRWSEIKQPIQSAPIDRESGGEDRDGGSTRFLHSVEVRFGVDAAKHKASTADLSAGGLFVVTNGPLPAGRRIKLVLELENASLPMIGTVAWVRPSPEEGRQAGMGVQLHNPPALYLHYVTTLD